MGFPHYMMNTLKIKTHTSLLFHYFFGKVPILTMLGGMNNKLLRLIMHLLNRTASCNLNPEAISTFAGDRIPTSFACWRVKIFLLLSSFSKEVFNSFLDVILTQSFVDLATGTSEQEGFGSVTDVALERFRFDFHYRYHYLNQFFSQSDELSLPN